MTRTARFSREDAKRFYDRFGSKQDSQGYYEDAALDALIRHGRFDDAKSVLEVGCGTGKLAARLLEHHLPTSASYLGIDISETMVDLAAERLRPWGARAMAVVSDGGFDFAGFERTFDRIIFTYVFDLLSLDDIATALAGAHAVARPGGLLCAAGLTPGQGVLTRCASALWTLVHRVKPALVGGCRPLVLADRLDPSQWRVVHRQIVVSALISSEVLIAEAA